MIAATAASRLQPNSPNVARPYIAPRRRSLPRYQPRRPATSRRVALDFSAGKPQALSSASGRYATTDQLAAAAAVVMALEGDSVAERTLAAAAPARFRDLDVRTVQASGLSQVDLEELLHDLTKPGIDIGMFDAPAAAAVLGAVPTRDERVVSFAAGETGALFVELDGLDPRKAHSADELQARLADLLEPSSSNGRELYAVLDFA